MTDMEKGKVLVADKAIEYVDGGVVSKELVHTKAGSVTLFSFDQGQQFSEHSAPFDVLLNILEGEPEVMIDGTAHHPKAGEILIIPANHPHAVKAVTKFKMQITMLRG